MIYVEHTSVEVHDFRIVDATVENAAVGGICDLIWVGCYGEGRWVTPDEAEQLAGALFGAAALHRARVDSKVAA